MAKKSDNARVFKAPSKKGAAAPPSTTSPQTNTTAGMPMQFVSYLLFLYNYIHFTKEERNHKGEGVLEDNVINLVSTHDDQVYSLMLELAKDLKIVSPSESAEDATPQKIKELYGKLFSVLSATAESPNDQKFITRVKMFAETIRKETIEKMVKFLTGYKFNKCAGVNQSVLRINDLLVSLGRLLPVLNVRMIEYGLISGWLLRILKENTENAQENIEVYRLFATQWIHVIVGEYQMFRRSAKEKAVQKKQNKIAAKTKELQKRQAAKAKKLEKRQKEIEEKIRELENSKDKKKFYDDDDLLEDEVDEEEERLVAELEEIEKSDDSGADDPTVSKIRRELFAEKFVKTACDILKSLPEYHDKETIVIISTDPNFSAEKKVTVEDHKHKCNALLFQDLLLILKELLTSTFAFDDDLFNELSASMVNQGLDSVLSFAFSNLESVNTVKRSFNWLYFLLHNSDDEIRLKLLDHVYRVVEIFKGAIDEKDGKIIFKEETLCAACLYLIGYATAASRNIAFELHQKYPEFFQVMIELFKNRSFPTNVLTVLYGSITSLVRYAISDEELIALEERFQFVDEVLTDVHTPDSLVRYPGIVMTRIILERLNNMDRAKYGVQVEGLYKKVIDSRASDVMLETIFDKRYQEEGNPSSPQTEMFRVLHQRFLHPGSLCTLNVLLDQSSKTGSAEVNNSLVELVNSDDRYIEILQFMKFLQQTKVKSFQYKNVFVLIGLTVVALLLFPVLVRFFGKGGVPPVGV